MLRTSPHTTWVGRLLVYALLAWALVQAAPARALPALGKAEMHRLHELTYAGDTMALHAYMQALRGSHDVAAQPAWEVYEALLLGKQEKGQAAMQLLHKPLLFLQQQWQQSPNRDHATDYVLALTVKADLHDLLAEKPQRDAAKDEAYRIALQALGPEAMQTRWLLYARMYAAIATARFPLALELAAKLEAMLPKPLSECKQDICISLRFQQANLARSIGQHRRALDLSKALAADVEAMPESAAWNIYQLIGLTTQLGLAQEQQYWCRQAQRKFLLPAFAQQEGLNRALGECLLSGAAARQDFDALLRKEAQERGAGSDGIAHLLRLQAESFSKQGRYAQAVHAGAQLWAIGIARQTDYWQWLGQFKMAHALAKMQRMPEAIYYAKQAINAQQRMISHSRELDATQRDALLATGRDLYEDVANWLLDRQRFAEAEQALTMAREQNYHRLVRSHQPAQRTLALTPAEQQHFGLTVAWQRQLQAAWKQRESDSASLEQHITAAAQLLNARMQPSSRQRPPPADLLPLAAGQTEIRYLPAPKHVYVVVRRAGHTERHVRLPIRQEQLTQDIALLRRQLQQPGSNPQALAHKLYRQLWQPLTALLPQAQPQAAAGQAPEIRVHLEGALRYLPMAALYDGQHWLGEAYALPLDAGVPTPAAGSPRQAAARDGWSLQGSSRAVADLPALPKVREEIENLAHLAADYGIPHEQKKDEAFTVESLRQALHTRKVVHLASHFRLQPGNALASGLYLGDGQLLTLGELNDPGFQFEDLDLLTLSACETAIPSGGSDDDLSLDSLAWLAQARGAHHVLASLWAVADEGTQQFMTAFYTALASPMGHAQALRAAQLTMLSQRLPDEITPTLRGLTPQPERTATMPSASGLAHPYYWSAFVLMAGAH